MQAQVFNRGLAALGQRQDLVLVMLIVAAIIMMILPLPTWMVDILIATNMAFTVLLLMVAIYLKKPVDMPVLPAVILIATVFRLALSITTTRLILLQADAGQIIETFGNFVVAGNLVVGLVIFLIITVVQFVVITKGAERVAEVGARFTLDALPGKQMSIDAELRNGDINKEEARERRQLLERESQLYGAMDGAMKFVKGDAIAGLVIIAINLLGGIIIGTQQLGYSFREATQIYSLLTVGDGLVVQIPALFVSVAAGVVVTRVSYEGSINLGTDIARHMLREVKPLELAAVVIFFLGFVPGFPTLVFAALATFFVSLAMVRRFDARRAARTRGSIRVQRLDGVHPVTVRLTPRATRGVTIEEIRASLGESVERVSAEFGLPLPSPEVVIEEPPAPNDIQVEVEEVPVAQAVVLDDEEASLLPAKGGGASQAKALLNLANGSERPPPETEAALARAGEVMSDVLRRHAAMLIGLEQTQQVLNAARQTDATLVDEALRHLPVPKFCLLFRQMLAEGLTLRHHRAILEAVVALGADGSDIPGLVDHVRLGLRRQLAHAHRSADGRIHAIVLPPAVEGWIRKSMQKGPQGTWCRLPPEQNAEILRLLRSSTEVDTPSIRPIVLTAFDIRRPLGGILMANNIKLAVLAYEEITPDFEVLRLPIAEVVGKAGPDRPQQTATVQ